VNPWGRILNLVPSLARGTFLTLLDRQTGVNGSEYAAYPVFETDRVLVSHGTLSTWNEPFAALVVV
jgi:hypothetical protein